MASFKQGSSSKFQDYMIQLIHKIHDAEEMLLSGDDRHLDELREISDMIEQYVNEAKGHKFEPMSYQRMQGNPKGQQAFFDNRYTDYPEMERGRDTRGHIGYIPYYPPIYPIFNEGQGGGGQGGSRGGSGQGYSNERGNRRG